MKYFAGMLAIVALVAGATVGAYRAWDRATHTREDNGGVIDVGTTSNTLPADTPGPAEGQVIVSGTVTAADLEGAALASLAMPITVTTANRGQGGATITPVLVNGTSTSVEWTAGQPFPLSGDGGSLALGPIAVEVTDGIALVLDGVHGVAAGTYSVATSVAVGSQPKDAVTFTATEQTTIQFRGTATTPVESLTTTGSGTMSLEGALTIAHPDRTTTQASTITLDSGTYTITLTPAVGGGFNVEATLQGPTH